MLACLHAGLTLLALLAPAQEGGQETPADAASLTKEVLGLRDDADPELVRRLANLRTAEALEGLSRFYDVVGSVYMRRIALNGFSVYCGVADLEAQAMQKLTDIATLTNTTELRETAVDALAGCRGGRPFLAAIVNSTADDAIRERALAQHVASASAEDVPLYERIFASDEEKSKRSKKDEPPEFLYTNPLKALAYEGMVATRTPKQLVEDTESEIVEVRRRALEELAARRADELEDRAEHMFERREERPDVRLLAAELLLQARGPRFAADLYKEAKRGAVPLELVFGIADILAALDDEKLDDKAVKALGGGQEREKRFHIRLTGDLPDPKVDKALLKLSEDRDHQVRIDAVRAMGRRGNPTFVPRLQELLEEEEAGPLLAAVIEALDRIQSSDPAWRAKLGELVDHPTTVVRNTALAALGASGDTRHLPTLIAALEHENWSTRLTAAKGIEQLRQKEGVGALCARIEHEEGRMAKEFADILWRLTAKPFSMDGGQWKRWWDGEGADFRFPTATELQRSRAEKELREDKQVSRSFRGVKVDSRFFGLRIRSHHVAFVIDVSGSMEWKLPGQERNPDAPSRIEIARKELLACMEALEAGTKFNILAFSSGVQPWREEAVECTEETFADAQSFVQALGAFGGTNIHGGLRSAFNDASVDTIFFLSDGEPSAGATSDPLEIREAVQTWNEERGVVIHTISIGERFPLLEWLAEDSGGQYRTYP